MINYLPDFEKGLKALYGLSEMTVKLYSSSVKDFFSWLEREGKDTDPKVIIPKDVEQYLEYLFYRGNGNNTRVKKFVALSKFFQFLAYRGLISEVVTKNIPRPHITRKFMLTFSRGEICRFFRVCDPRKENSLRDICILILLAFCGLRINEIVTIDLNSIMDDGRDVDIFVLGKRRHNRQVYLWKAPGKIIRQYLMIRISQGARGSDPFLISYRGRRSGNRLSAGAIHGLLKKLAVKAEIRKPGIHAHMFRATHANDLQRIKGYTIPAIQERMGWKDLSTAGRYLVHHERIHRIYDSLHAYWNEFPHLWNKDIDRSEELD